MVKACRKPYVTKDRAAIEGLLATDYTFTSPIDNKLSRESYFEICWPNSENMTGFDFIEGVEVGGDGLRGSTKVTPRTAKSSATVKCSRFETGRSPRRKCILVGTSRTRCQLESTKTTKTTDMRSRFGRQS